MNPQVRFPTHTRMVCSAIQQRPNCRKSNKARSASLAADSVSAMNLTALTRASSLCNVRLLHCGRHRLTSNCEQHRYALSVCGTATFQSGALRLQSVLKSQAPSLRPCQETMLAEAITSCPGCCTASDTEAARASQVYVRGDSWCATSSDWIFAQ